LLKSQRVRGEEETMSDADWDAEDFEPGTSKKEEPVKPSDKWDGEDEDDDAKEAWDKSTDEEDGDQPKAIQRKKKKKIEDILEEKAAKQRAELEAKAAASAAKKHQDTPEGRAAEKARLRKLDENESLLLAKDMMGLGVSHIDKMAPVTKEDFEIFEKELAEKVTSFSSSENYPEFVEKLVRRLCVDLPAPAIKNIKKNVEAAHTAKLKEEQAAKSKKGKGKGASLKMGTDKDLFSSEKTGGYDDMDDFM